MRPFFLFLLLFFQTLFAVDFDCIFVGTSPIPLFEALYQHSLGKKVLILEQDSECGGAWRSVTVCGIAHADLGCHWIGYNSRVIEFLEVYGGCKIVSLDQLSPSVKNFKGGYYFSKGCHELIHNLTEWIEKKTDIVLLLNTQLESVFVDTEKKEVVAKTKESSFTAKKIFYTPLTGFQIENQPTLSPCSYLPKYYHLYLLIQDPAPQTFTYQAYRGSGASRMMNLTHFLGLEPYGQQLVVFQVYSENAFTNGELFLDNLKQKNLLSPSAYILKEEGHIYEGSSPFRATIAPEWQPYFEQMNTSSFILMTHYIGKWEKALLPYREIFP